jgi:hypothetical protein
MTESVAEACALSLDVAAIRLMPSENRGKTIIETLAVELTCGHDHTRRYRCGR